MYVEKGWHLLKAVTADEGKIDQDSREEDNRRDLLPNFALAYRESLFQFCP